MIVHNHSTVVKMRREVWCKAALARYDQGNFMFLAQEPFKISITLFPRS